MFKPIVEKKIVLCYVDKNDPWYYYGILTFLKEPVFEIYIRDKRSWRNLWISFWSYRVTFQSDPREWLDNIVEVYDIKEVIRKKNNEKASRDT